MNITKKFYGRTESGDEVYLFTLTNSKGMIVEIINYGAIIVSIIVPDKNGKMADVNLGFDSLEGYLHQKAFIGAILGRHANRVEGARFTLNNFEYQLANNEGHNHLHGGNNGFDKVIWHAEVIKNELHLTYHSYDGEEGYPGNLKVKVIYSLSNDNGLSIDYSAIADQDTIVNLTNHAYFNLSGHASGDILHHQLKINADQFTKINQEGLPTGEFCSVKGTPMDFSDFTSIGPGLSSNDQQIVFGCGYDINYVLKVSSKTPEKAAEVFDPVSGRYLEIFTTKPGIQFYSGNHLNISNGKGNSVYRKWSGFCLETQFFPNATRHKHFPSPILKAGAEYRHSTIYKFSS